MNIEGKVVYQDLGTGFWGIVGNDGQEWRPLEMPKALQKKGLSVKVKAKEAEAQMSVFMWGTAIQIENYEIVSND